MELERERVVEIVVAVGGVGLFIALVVVIGLLFGDGGLSETGAFALVGTIIAFIVVMTGVGFWLAGQEF